ncbi:glycosyltransferase [Paenibacillus sp. MAHUQ-46]|uniref:Glycosyltransferase n=2 Tax=Paenibacillus TaxID=44249 RepID=A0A934J3Q2_9BACL|nr:glycosyltransferase [Paenibacillus roseus]
MIVKNEAASIGRCLDSVKNIVNEIVIVDTGSSDNTLEICKTFDAQVFSFPWNDSFAEARNFGLNHARGDWIMWLDADEQCTISDLKAFSEQLKQETELIYAVHLVNYIGKDTNPDHAFHITQPRLIRNHRGFKFINRIHETFDLTNAAPYLLNQNIPVISAVFHHYGYMDDVIYAKNKVHRNIALLQREISDQTHSPWMEYHLAVEYARLQYYEESFKFVNLSIARFVESQLMPPSLLYRLKYSVLIASGNLQPAQEGIEKALLLYPDYIDLHFYKALILYLMNQFDEALEQFEHCLAIGDQITSHLSLKGTGSFQAWYYKGLCYEQLGCPDKAADAYQKAADLSCGYEPAINALKKRHSDSATNRLFSDLLL